ncbi:MAG: acetamidase/formamidase family protein [Saprospiraceae bacterium]|nr:acetamidase/formamidase family protein [Saprospiraceae bacterium]
MCQIFHLSAILIMSFLITSCQPADQTPPPGAEEQVPEPQYTLTKDQTHNKFSSAIPPVLRVPSGAVIEVFTEEASDEQLEPGSEASAVENLDFDPIHPLTGPVFIEGAQPGDVLKVRLHKVEPMGWGWTAIAPGFGFLADLFTEPYLKTFNIEPGQTSVAFTEKINIPLRPFPGVMGVAPDTDEMLSTIPPRANGGNMDDPHLTEGTTVYFPVFVEGALFSIGDAHAAQGMGEVCGTAIEVPMRIIYQVELVKGGRVIPEPEYETEDYYAVTAFGTSIDQAAKKAVTYMVDYLVEEHGLSPQDAYALCSLAGDLKIAEVVDVPHMLVAMHMSKEVLGMK